MLAPSPRFTTFPKSTSRSNDIMLKEAATTLMALTGTTDLGARFLGAGAFLPAVDHVRYAACGMLDIDEFKDQLNRCTAFADAKWAGYWTEIAYSYLARVELELGLDVRKVAEEGAEPPAEFVKTLAAGSRLLRASTIGQKIDESWEASAGDRREMMVLLDTIRTMTYLFFAAWPGKTPERQKAYPKSGRLFRAIVEAVAGPLGFDVERSFVETEGERVEVYGLFPRGASRLPAMLCSNGLEGAIQELAIPLLRVESAPAAAFIMEMPGTYAYQHPMSRDRTPEIYSAVISHIASHPRVDPGRIGMFGLSFGGHWSTRMALEDSRLKAVISNGPPLRIAFGVLAAFGMPQCMVEILTAVAGARSVLTLAPTLQKLAFSESEYVKIDVPILCINGDHDTLVPTKDTTDLAQLAPKAELRLYPDDHCAMGHVPEWLAASIEWFVRVV